MTESAKHSVSVAGVIVNDEGQVLLIRRRDNGHWEPPGGVLEIDETIADGLQREVFEESGLSVEPIRLTGIYKNMKLGVLALVFLCRIVSGKLALNPEVSDFRWARRSEIENLMTATFARRVTDALDGDRTASVRSHNGRNFV
ncbi:NUDIX domain-containing protein [Yinghuangia aomiensis]|uniref:NUDIX domain-containing protein n=1 Tax=Yinghuangia aomiensis TaxID=676205 RepID=A0ABP9HZN2_9ACTN